MKKLMILATVVGLFAMVSMAFAQPAPGDIAVTLDEAGTLTMGTFAELGVPDASFPTTHIHVFIVTYGISELAGYEFSLTYTGGAPFGIAKILYGPAPLDFGGDDYDVRAGAGGCIAVATDAGSDPNSWTMADFDLNYFGDPGNDVYYCVHPSTSNSTNPTTPLYTTCDAQATKHAMAPANVDTAGIAPEGCAVLNPTMGQDVVGDDATSWGSLKAGF